MDFFVYRLTSFGFDHNFDHNANDFIWSNSCRSVQFSGRKRLAEQLDRTLPNGFLNMEIMLSHLGVGMAYIVSMGWILFMQKKGLWQQLIHAAAGCEKFFFTLGGLVLMMNLHIFPFMLTIYDYFLNRSLCILCHAKGRIIYKKFFRM